MQELIASAAGASTRVWKAASNCWVFGPVVIQPDRRVSTTSSISAWPMAGGENSRNSLRVVRGGSTGALDESIRPGSTLEASGSDSALG